MKKGIKHILFAVTALVIGGCADDPHEGGGKTTVDGEKEVTISLYLPGVATRTRALDNAGENRIVTIDILGFRNDGGTEKYLYHTHGIDLTAVSASRLSFKTYLRESSIPGERHRIVVLANLRDVVDNAKGSFAAAMTKEEILEIIKFNSEAEWEVGSDYTPLPMWGESAALHTVNGNITGSDIGSVTMMRAVARLDVGLNMNGTDYAPQGLGNSFRLSSVKVYNSRGKGYASPQPGTTDNSGNVLYPSAAGIPVNGGTHSYPVPPPYYGLTNTIYVAEAQNRHRANDSSPWQDLSDPMFLVVGGYYQADGSTESWYRIDMRDSGGDMMDVLRNHRYIINITAVSGAGYHSEAQAAVSKSMNINAEVAYLSDSDVKHAVFDDYYMLGVSDREITVGRRGAQHPASFTTDYPNEWNIRISDNADHTAAGNIPSWISLNTAASGAGAGTYGITFTTSAYTGYTSRTAYIHITAGRLHNSIAVTQNTRDAVTLQVDPDIGETLFMSGLGVEPTGTQTFNLAWTPAGVDLAVSASALSGYDPVVVNGLPSTLSGGSGTIAITPEPMPAAEIAANPSKIRALRIDFTVTSEFGTTLMRTVMLRQRHIGVKASPTRVYKLLGGTDILDVYCNTAWEAVLEPEGTAIDYLTDASGTGTGGGEQIGFRMQTGSNSHISGLSYIVITSPTSEFDPVRVAITACWGHPFLRGDQHLVAYPASSPDLQRTFSGASTYCSGLGSGWRVPSTTELQSIYYQIANTAAERTALNLQEGIYWSSTYKAFNYYYMDMSDGQLGNNTLSLNQHYVRCVRNQ